jgi:hypothetical protein
MGAGELVFNTYGVSIRKDEKCLKEVDGDGQKITWH